MNDNGDQLVADYLRRLSAAASHLPAGRRTELLDEITAHIAEARAGAAPGPAGVRTVLDQLGDPEEIVSAAEATSGHSRPRTAARAPAFEIVTVVLLLIGGIVVPIVGWIVGVVLLWTSNRWRTSDKVLGTLVWPGGLAVPLAVLIFGSGAALLLPASECTGGSVVSSTGHATGTSTITCTPPAMPAWLAIMIFAVVLLATLAGPVLVAIRLMRRARHEITSAYGADQEMTFLAT